MTYDTQPGDVLIDYHAAYRPGESYAEFVQRVAEEHFPQQGRAWVQRYAASLHFYGVHVYNCEHCEGKCCPQHGHRFFLAIKKGTALPVPYAHAKLCPKYVQMLQQRALAKARAQAQAEAMPPWEEGAPDERTAPAVTPQEEGPEVLTLF